VLQRQSFDRPFILLEDDPLLRFDMAGPGPAKSEALSENDSAPETSLDEVAGPEPGEADTSPAPPPATPDEPDPVGTPFSEEAGEAPWSIPYDLEQVAAYIRSGDASADDLDVGQLLRDRPDVFAAFYRDFYGPNNDRNSSAWVDRVGGETVQDYARYWYDTYGKWEGYAQTERAAAANISIERLLQDRPDVFRAYYTEYYGPNNDRNSSAWADRVGGETLHDYAKYWYKTYGKAEGYTQTPTPEYAPSQPDPESGDAAGKIDIPGGSPHSDPPELSPREPPPTTELSEPVMDLGEEEPLPADRESPPITLNLPLTEADFVG